MALLIGVGQPLVTARLQAYDGTNWVNLLVQESTQANLKTCICYLDNVARVFSNDLDARSTLIKSLYSASFLYGFNGSSWNRIRCISDADGIADDIGNLTVMGKTYVYGEGSWRRFRAYYKATLGTFTTPGAGSSFECATGASKFTWIVLSDANTSDCTVNFEGSIDNTNWFVLDTWSGTGNTMRHVVNKPIKYVRANVVDMGDATEITVKYFGMP